MWGKSRKMVIVLSGVMMMATCCGCLAVIGGVGAGTYLWVKGALVAEYAQKVPDVHAAVLAGMEQLGLDIEEEWQDNRRGSIRAKFADGSKAKVDIEALTEFNSKLTIRVGFFGDKVKSEMIYNVVQKNL